MQMEIHGAIPLRSDWGDFTRDFDVADAYATFGGKSNFQMQSYFAKNITMRAQDVGFMPARPFKYYFKGFTDFIVGGQLGDDAEDAANCYIDVIWERLLRESEVVLDLRDTVECGLNMIANNLTLFNKNPEIYGDMSVRIGLIRQRMAELAP